MVTTRRQQRNLDWFDEIGEAGAQNIRRMRATGRMQTARRWVKRYHPNDFAKRRRLADDQPKTERVSAYVRRT